jgi:hypothetical protein
MWRWNEVLPMIRKLVTWIALGLLLPSLAVAQPLAVVRQNREMFYFSPHEDDWQLFMQPNAIKDLANSAARAVVFVYITAGDAGCYAACEDTSATAGWLPYYQVREQGAIRSMRFAVELERTPPTLDQSSTVTINGHAIWRWQYGNAIAYFLRLPNEFGPAPPDNNLRGTPFEQFSLGRITSMEAVDGSTTYTSWQDLINTVGQIVAKEGQGLTTIWLNNPDPNETNNPGDHGDHLAVGRMISDLRGDGEAAVSNWPNANTSRATFEATLTRGALACANVYYTQDYNTQFKPVNVTNPTDQKNVAATFGVQTSTLNDFDIQTTFLDHAAKWMWKIYGTAISVSGSCSLVAAEQVQLERKRTPPFLDLGD